MRTVIEVHFQKVPQQGDYLESVRNTLPIGRWSRRLQGEPPANGGTLQANRLTLDLRTCHDYGP